MSVHAIGTPNLRDVPASLRLLADLMECGEVARANHVIVVVEDDTGAIACYGYGDVRERAYEIGILHMAALQLAALYREGL